MMFVKENLLILKKYYEEVSKKIKGVLPLKFAGLPEWSLKRMMRLMLGKIKWGFINI
jgi:hypothetical protein